MLEKLLDGFEGKRVLEIGCGGGEVVRALEDTGAIASCADVENRHASASHVNCSATEISQMFEGESFDCVLALALFGSPLAQWCMENGTNLRETEMTILGQARAVLKPGGLFIVYNADSWLPHLTELKTRDFEATGFSLEAATGNDTLILRAEKP